MLKKTSIIAEISFFHIFLERFERLKWLQLDSLENLRQHVLIFIYLSHIATLLVKKGFEDGGKGGDDGRRSVTQTAVPARGRIVFSPLSDLIWFRYNIRKNKPKIKKDCLFGKWWFCQIFVLESEMKYVLPSVTCVVGMSRCLAAPGSGAHLDALCLAWGRLEEIVVLLGMWRASKRNRRAPW